MRDGMKIAEVYNDGLMVYLYDDAHRERLRDFATALVHQSASEPAHQRAVKAIAADRLLVGYELRQDDSVRLGVIVGEPLTTKEKKGAAWRKPAATLLSLPSGRLCIESLNSLRIDEEDPGDKGAVVEVPKGDYVLTLHRIDWEKQEDGYEGPPEIVTLTPLKAVAKPPKPKVILTYSNEPRAPWAGKYEIEDDVFLGEIIGHDEEAFVVVNADERARLRLGWRRGSRLRATIAGVTVDAYFSMRHTLERDRVEGFREQVKGLGWARVESMQRINWKLCSGYAESDAMAFGGLDVQQLGETWQRVWAQTAGTPVRIEKATPFIANIDTSWTERARVEGACIIAEVVECTRAERGGSSVLVTNCSEALLRRLKLSVERPLEVTAPDFKRVFHLRNPAARCSFTWHEDVRDKPWLHLYGSDLALAPGTRLVIRKPG